MRQHRQSKTTMRVWSIGALAQKLETDKEAAAREICFALHVKFVLLQGGLQDTPAPNKAIAQRLAPIERHQDCINAALKHTVCGQALHSFDGGGK